MEDFEQVYAEYFPVVYRYALSLCGDETMAEELAQETFFKALKKLDSFRGQCQLRVWLCQIAKNTWLKTIRRRAKTAETPSESIPGDDDPEQALLDRDTAARAHRVLHGLPEPYKEVFWMRVFGELSFREIGAIWGRSESWARVTYHRAKLKIKEEAT